MENETELFEMETGGLLAALDALCSVSEKLIGIVREQAVLIEQEGRRDGLPTRHRREESGCRGRSGQNRNAVKEDKMKEGFVPPSGWRGV